MFSFSQNNHNYNHKAMLNLKVYVIFQDNFISNIKANAKNLLVTNYCFCN